MERSLFYLILALSIIVALFLIYLSQSRLPPSIRRKLTFLTKNNAVLSTCLGPPLLRAFKSYLATQKLARSRSANGKKFDYNSDLQSDAGFRRSKGREYGFDQGRGGAEGFEMSALGVGEDLGEESD